MAQISQHSFTLLDCGIPANPTGYTLTAGANAADKLEGATATVACATGYSEDAGTPTGVQCQAGGTWAAPTGCTVVGKNMFRYIRETSSAGRFIA